MLAILAQRQGSYVGFGDDAGAAVPATGLYVFIGVFVVALAIGIAISAILKKRSRAATRRAAGRASKKRDRKAQKDMLSEFAVSVIDMDPVINPPTDRPPSIPDELPAGTVLMSKRLGVKCLLIDNLTEVSSGTLKEICARKLSPAQATYLPVGTQVYHDEILQQNRGGVKLRKGGLFLGAGGQPNTFLLNDLRLPLRKELSRTSQILPVTESTAQKYLQDLVDIPSSFELIKEEVLLDTSKENVREVEKGTLVISRSGALVGLMLENYNLPHRGPLGDLDSLFQLRTQYERYPIETLIQRAAKTGGRPIQINRGTFIFSSAGKVYFVWKEGLEADEQTLTSWARGSQISSDGIIEVSKTKGNDIGGPGVVINQEELNYLRDVFRQAGTTNIRQQTLLLEQSMFFKFMGEMPYAQTGRFRHLLGKPGGVFQLNSASRGTFSIELGGKDVEMTELDLQAVRKHLMPDGKLLIKIGTLLRIRDERYGDWVYKAHTNLFYPYDTLTRPFMEEFIPESIRYSHREPKSSTIIGFQDKPTVGDVGAAGEPVGDLIAIINGELFNKEKNVFVLDGTMFHWNDRLYRVNEELAFRTYEWTNKLEDRDFQGLAADWKINTVVEDGDSDEEVPAFVEEEDLEDLPFDTGALR
ncbi:MAG: hypothetical protein VX733_06890 [Candidatus Latescibacterota bacterium]|nr:hypothetical protein [Candidatus Latescibacterota bacterium]